MARVLALALFVAGSGCTELGEYRGDYAGDVLGGLTCAEGEGPCSFIRRGFRGGTTLTLEGYDPTVQTYDPTAGTGPGRLSTDDEHCGAGTATFIDEPLKPIPALAHDALAELDVPGSGRLRTQIYAVEPTRGPLAGRDAMVFLTLMEGGDLEVRVVAGDGAELDCATLPEEPAPPADCEPRSMQECDFFGVFELSRGAS
jgi:hypothetical protein